MNIIISLLLTFTLIVGASKPRISISSGPHEIGSPVQISLRPRGIHGVLVITCFETINPSKTVYEKVLIDKTEEKSFIDFTWPDELIKKDEVRDNIFRPLAYIMNAICKVRWCADISCTHVIKELKRIEVFEKDSVYGMLTMHGYANDNEGLKTDQNAEFVLARRIIGNSLIPGRLVKQKLVPQIVPNSVQIHSRMDTDMMLSSVVTRNRELDQFQLGRDPSSNDFLVPGKVVNKQTAASRLAFRINCDRESKRCWLYAAGFDKNKNIFLGENSVIFESDDGLTADGFVTAGLNLYKPSTGKWSEISVFGKTFKRSFVDGRYKIEPISDADNELEHGSIIINSCNAFIFHVPGAEESNTKISPEQFNQAVEDMMKTTCPIEMDAFQAMAATPSVPIREKVPCVYPECGHAFNHIEDEHLKDRCLMCRTPGKATSLKLKFNNNLDGEKPEYVLSCGHVVGKECLQRIKNVPMYDNSHYWTGEPEKNSNDPVFHKCPFCHQDVKPDAKKLFLTGAPIENE